MIEKTIRIENEDGLHGRPAAKLMAFAKSCSCKIELRFGGKSANAKSLLDILSLGVSRGDEVTFVCDGEGEEEALEALEKRLTAPSECA